MMKNADASRLVAWMNDLGDVTRLRILSLIEYEELGVGELSRIVQLPQSTVSRHLKQLFENGWVIKRTVGTASLYRMVEDEVPEAAGELWKLAREQVAATSTFTDDRHRMKEVLAERQTDSKAFFGRIGGEWDELRRELFGRDFSADALLGLLPPNMVVADVGCGTGDATAHLAPFVGQVIAIDREPAMLDAARKRLKDCANVSFRTGDLERLPLEDGSVDAATVFLVLHHVDQPAAAVRELSRVVKPGGVVMIVDMVAHDREMYRHTMGHLHLGFDEKDLRRWAQGAGLGTIRVRRLRPDTESKGPGLFVATLRKDRPRSTASPAKASD